MSIYGVPASPTTYDRNVALKDSIFLAAGSSRTLSVEHVHSYYSETCPGISINLRKSSASPAFVTITNNLASATVSIDTLGVSIGSYTLTLESFDNSLDSSQATLKIDTVIIYVTEFTRLSSIASSMMILRGNSASFAVDHLSSAITLPATTKFELRQNSAS